MFCHMWRSEKLVTWTLKFTRLSHSLKRKMAATELLRRLETRAITAEQIIASLKNEVAELKKIHVQEGNKVKVQQLEVENEKLRKEIEEWRNKLIQLEIASGTKQVPLPGLAATPCAVVPPALKPVTTPLAESAPQITSVSDKEESKEKKRKEKQPAAAPKKAKGGTDGSGPGEEPPVDVGRLDLRVGRIVAVKKHPDADSLYVEEVEVGEEKPRTVVSGLVKHVSLEDMQDRMVVLLCNLKPAKMRGVTSEAMVMCASSPDKVEILVPPAGCIPGDKVHVEGYPCIPDPVLNPKKKIFETVAPDLKTNADKVATYKGIAFSIPGKGVVTAPSLIGVNIK